MTGSRLASAPSTAPATPTPDELAAVGIDRHSAPGQSRRWLGVLIKAAVSVGLIWWILAHAPLPEIFGAIRAADPLKLALAASLLPLGVVLGTMRWNALLHAHGVYISPARLYASQMTALFFRQFMPGTIGADAVRAVDVWRMGAPKSVAVTSVAIDRVFGLLALVLFACAALIFGHVAADVPVIRVFAGAGAVGLARSGAA